MTPHPYFRQTRLAENTWLFSAYDPVYRQYHQATITDPIQPVAVAFKYSPGPDILTIGFVDAAGRTLSQQSFTFPKQEE